MNRNRQSTRLKGYDYGADGAYFITINSKNRIPWFGEIANCEMRLSDAGKILNQEWLKTAELRKEIRLDEYIIMPDHMHAIVVIGEPVIPLEETVKGLPGKGVLPYAPTTAAFRSPSKTLGAMVRGFKGTCASKIRETISEVFAWQRGYHDRIIRDQGELKRIQNYIKANPSNWKRLE